ncbi:MAG: DUF433 domain-containing protein [Chloroflexi bacterium]|nr:DUF433 domain-containing protein [Chloroflexota bacterium]MCC6893038.1 DUF433 domain-containing protein [Anaerolineae bacterium]
MDLRIPEGIDLRKYIDTDTFMARPHIRGRRVPVATIAYSARDLGWDIAKLAYEFTLSETQVLAALLYYQEQKVLIDNQEAEYQAQLDEAYRMYSSKD